MPTQKVLEQKLRDYEQQRAELTAELSRAGFIWHGTIQRRRLTCGRPACKCHVDPDKRHGPYAYWTTKVAGRTVSRLLAQEEADLYEEWIENRRRIDDTVEKLKAVSRKAASVVLKLRSGQAKRSHG